jgi:hypothetical protein
LTSAARSFVLIAAGACAFALAATANSGGYRYGASDQAFYIPAVRQAMDGTLFPRDGWLLAAQGRVILWDGLAATVATVSNLPLPWVFFLFYLTGLLALYAGGTLIARAVGMGPWGTVAFLAMLTLRHRIAKTGVNTLEGYLHPRMIAFAVGLMAVAAFLRRKPAWAAAALVAACALHPTTGVWFGMMLGAAAFAAWPRWRAPLGAVAVIGAAATVWAVAAGPLAARAVVMDAPWLAAIEGKDYLFPHEWPAYAWLFNFLPVAIAGAALWRMQDLQTELRGLLIGALALAAFFLVTLPFVAMRYALAVQMQIPRVFWLVELVAFIVIVLNVSAMVVAGRVGARAVSVSPVKALALFLILLSVVRGASIVIGEKDGRLVTVDLPADDWTNAMMWLRAQPAGVHVLADPDHAWMYGSSVRVAAERDVFHEDIKDAALAMYDRNVAMRVVERRALAGGLGDKGVDELRALAARYALDYLVTDRRLPLPLAYENATFRVYTLR